MDTRKVILLAGALIVAALTAFMARSLIAGSAAPEVAAAPLPVKVEGPEVLVATRALPVGTILDATAFKFQPWPKELVENAYFLKEKADIQSLVGTVVRNAVTAGQPLTQGSLVKPGDRGFLAAALGPGMRAVTFPVNNTGAGSAGGFVFPGDRIDLVLTQEVKGGGDGDPLKVSETVMRNVRVLAVDQRTDNEVGEDGKTHGQTYSTLTIEATPRMAEQIAVAQKIGELSIALRSIADNPGELEEAIARGDVTVPNGADAKAEREMLLRVASRPQTGSTTYATGADVSRFQRRTVPARPVSSSSSLGGGYGPQPSYPGAVAPGPVVRIARGNDVTVMPVKGK